VYAVDFMIEPTGKGLTIVKDSLYRVNDERAFISLI